MKRLISVYLIAVIFVPAFVSALTFTRSLSVGSRGEDVTALQHFLKTSGYLNAVPTGYFGILTEHAVAAFQNAHNLEAVGRVGPLTRSILNTSIRGSEISISSSAPSTFNAFPRSGSAPLFVTFRGMCDGHYCSIDY